MVVSVWFDVDVELIRMSFLDVWQSLSLDVPRHDQSILAGRLQFV
jgi:hypothetical protein